MTQTKPQDEELAALRTALADKERALEESASLLREVLLHTKNNTRMILSLLALQTDRVVDPEAREAGELAVQALRANA
jgi:two-component sensor histidine kinase